MNLTCNFINTERNETIEKFIRSLVDKSFQEKNDEISLIVNIQLQESTHTPWKCTMYLSRSNASIVNSEAQSANYLTAFSQALQRLERQWEKKEKGLRA